VGPKPMDIQRLEDQRREALEREQAALAERDRATQEATKLQAKHADCGPLLTDTGNENTSLKGQIGQLEIHLSQAKKDAEQFRSEAAMWRVQAQVQNPEVGRAVTLVHQTCAIFLPSLKFINDIVPLVLTLPNPQSLFVRLRQIEAAPVKGKQIGGADGWYEIHFSTGNDDDGRVYWRKVGQVRYVLVGFKDGQQGDIAKLRRFRPPN